jgi:hypothetical protein
MVIYKTKLTLTMKNDIESLPRSSRSRGLLPPFMRHDDDKKPAVKRSGGTELSDEERKEARTQAMVALGEVTINGVPPEKALEHLIDRTLGRPITRN